MAKITGIGGVFFKSTGDHAALAAWYRKHLGMPAEDEPLNAQMRATAEPKMENRANMAFS